MTVEKEYVLSQKGLVLCAVIFGFFRDADSIAKRHKLPLPVVESCIKELLDDGDLELDGEKLIVGKKWNI